MMLLLLIVVVCSFLSLNVHAQRTDPLTINSVDAQQLWASTFGGLRTGGSSTIIGGSIDPNDGSIVLAGSATGTFLGHASIGGADAFLIKMTPDGGLVWIRWFATVVPDSLMAVAIDLNGNIYATGWTSGALPGLTTPTGSDVFVARLNANGDQQWIRQLSSTTTYYSDDKSNDIGVDVFGFCYVAWGHSSAVLLSKFHSNGTQIFTQNYASTTGSSTYTYSSYMLEGQRGLSIINPIVNVSTQVAVVLAFVTTSPITYPFASFVDGGGYDIIVTRVLSSTGQPVWSRIYQTFMNDYMSGIKSDSSGSIYLSGTTQASMEGQIYTGTTNQNIFLSKLAFDGTKQWTVQYGAGTSNVYSFSLVVDNAGGVYVGGNNDQTTNSLMVDGLPTLYGRVSSNYAYPAILTKFDSDGFRLWTVPFCSYMPTRTTSYSPKMNVRTLLFDSATGRLFMAGLKNGLYTGDVDVTPRISDVDINVQQAFIIGVQQPTTNVTLAQWQTLLAQLESLLRTTSV